MIESKASGDTGSEACLVLRPNRSLSGMELAMVFACLAVSSVAVAVFSASQGNVLAPLFALLELALVAVCLRWVWLKGECYELIAVSPQAVSVRRETRQACQEVCFHPFWVRLTAQRDARDGRISGLWLASQGQRMEIGAFLGDGERERLREQLESLLQRVSGRAAV